MFKKKPFVEALPSHVGYLGPLTPKEFPKTVKRVAAMIKAKFPHANMIAGRGLSGAMVLPAIAAKLKCDWAIVRKDGSHSSYKVEASHWHAENSIVFVDDLIDTGTTLHAVESAVRDTLSRGHLKGSKANIVGAVVYYDNYCDPDTFKFPIFLAND